MIDDSFPTVSSAEEIAVEQDVGAIYRGFWQYVRRYGPDKSLLTLLRDQHAAFLEGALGDLPGAFSGMDPIRPWVAFWAVQGLRLLGRSITPSQCNDIVAAMKGCQHPQGGYGGGPHQLAHLGTTYAAVATLVSLKSESALQSIDVASMKRFLHRMCFSREAGGGLSVHDGGERDVRACYLAVAVAHMLGLDCEDLARRSDMVPYIARCQTYEGGLGGEPGNEAHGGYSYCGLAALAIVHRQDALDMARLLAWVVDRQSAVAGGFNGRANKLVDGCYSFWQGALVALVTESLPHAGAPARGTWKLQAECVPELPDVLGRLPFRESHGDVEGPQPPEALESYRTQREGAQHSATGTSMRLNARDWEAASRVEDMASCGTRIRCAADGNGAGHTPPIALFDALALQFWLLVACQTQRGLRDKPGKNADFYHTCYCLCGLAVSQQAAQCALGATSNEMPSTDLRINVLPDALAFARSYFLQLQA